MTAIEDNAIEKPKATLGFRHVQLVMMVIAMILGYSLRVNMSMAIVAMTDKDQDNTFKWSMQTQSVILSSFFWGYVMLQVPAGEIANRVGGNVLILICIGINSFVTLLIPTSAYYGGWQMVCACRVIQGLSQGALVPSVNCLIAKWAPIEEKSRFGTYIFAGSHLGTALQLMISGFIADYWGWPVIFYVGGTVGLLWTIIYIYVGSASPETSRMISPQERIYIQTSLGQVGGHKKLRTPWKSVWTSLPFIALIIVHCGQNWGFWTLMTEMPSYMKQVLGIDIKANGVMSALPYLAMYLLSLPFGYLSDYILRKQWLSITATRKLFNSIGHFGPALSLIGLSYAPNDVTIAVALLTIVVSLNAGHTTGLMLVHLDMAPNFAGSLMGVTNGMANLVSIIAPLVAGAILKDETDQNEWRKVFYISSAIYFAGNLLFLMFGTSERQKWNEPVSTEKNSQKPVDSEDAESDKITNKSV